MKHNNHGFSLIETVVAMAILGAFTVSICTCLVLSLRMNDKTESLMQEQMAVSSAVEELMADGIDYSNDEYALSNGTKIKIESVDGKDHYNVTVTNGNVTVTTQIRKAVP